MSALRELELMDTPAEADFDGLARLAAQICDTPIALITLLDDRRQWFKAKVGLDVCETSRDLAFCARAIEQQDLFIVPDALKDVRFATNTLVTSEPHIRFYAGAPLRTVEGHALGTLCVIDRRPRRLSSSQESSLRILARQVEAQLELRRQQCERRKAESAAREEHQLLLTLINTIPDRIHVKDLASRFLLHNTAEARSMGLAGDASLVGRSDADFYPADLAARHRANEETILATGQPRLHHEAHCFDLETGTPRWQLTTKVPLRNAGGEIVGLVGMSRDITASKEAEFTLRRQRLAMDEAVEGIAVLDDAGTYLYLNRAHATLFGYDSADELLGQSWRVLYGAGELARIEQEIFPRLMAEGHWQGEAVAQRRDGSSFHEGLSLTRVEGGGLIGCD